MEQKHKFRGHTGKKWVYGDLLNQLDNIEIVEGNTHYIVNPETVGKYITDDKKGIPIYEYDIIQLDMSLTGKEYYHVVYDLYNYRYALKRSLEYSGVKPFTAHCEVVGNIFENTDILERQDYEDNKNYKGYEPTPTCLTKQYMNKKLKQFLPR